MATEQDQAGEIPIRFTSLGNTKDIGASCHILQADGTTVALDAGADPNEDGPNSLPAFGAIDQLGIDHVLITHAHHDHIGSLPALIEAFPNAEVHLTGATRSLADQLLPASARLQRRKFYEGTSRYPPIFTEEQANEVSANYRTHTYKKPFSIPTRNGSLDVTFCYSGHILGAAGVLLNYRNGTKATRLFYTSDTCIHNQSIIPGGTYPDPPIDVLVMESTLGADEEAERVVRSQEIDRIRADLVRVLERDGTVLIPVFALGRAQEILALLDSFRRSGHLDPSIPIFTAGGLRAVAGIYDATTDSTPRLNNEFRVFDVDQRRFPHGDRAKTRVLGKPGIHVVTSGMMFANTLSNWIAQHIVEHERHAIFLVGYCKEDSPGGQLLEAVRTGADGIILDKHIGMQPLNCEVQRYRFSGHSHRRDLIGLAASLQPATVLLVHGETSARQWMADQLKALPSPPTVLMPDEGESVTV